MKTTRIEPSQLWAVKAERDTLRAENIRLKALLERVKDAVEAHVDGAVITDEIAVAKIEDLLA